MQLDKKTYNEYLKCDIILIKLSALYSNGLCKL
ncbi:MAG: hypothetical protein K0S71_1779 [Clostridia bacterium]|jgi:hypothetical protein|nr:hypothetical protein [Clostridia bacterium]